MEGACRCCRWWARKAGSPAPCSRSSTRTLTNTELQPEKPLQASPPRQLKFKIKMLSDDDLEGGLGWSSASDDEGARAAAATPAVPVRRWQVQQQSIRKRPLTSLCLALLSTVLYCTDEGRKHITHCCASSSSIGWLTCATLPRALSLALSRPLPCCCI